MVYLESRYQRQTQRSACVYGFPVSQLICFDTTFRILRHTSLYISKVYMNVWVHTLPRIIQIPPFLYWCTLKVHLHKGNAIDNDLHHNVRSQNGSVVPKLPLKPGSLLLCDVYRRIEEMQFVESNGDSCQLSPNNAKSLRDEEKSHGR